MNDVNTTPLASEVLGNKPSVAVVRFVLTAKQACTV